MARERKRKKKDDDEGGIDPNGWMITFSDLLTLLMTFFVLLLSMSSMDTKALRSMFSMFVGAANVLNFAQFSAVEPIMILQPKMRPELIQEVLERIMDDYRENKLTYELPNLEISVSSKRNSVFITFPALILFDPGSKEVKPDLIPLLEEIVKVIEKTDYLVRIEGHTDNIPAFKGDYTENWKLSSLRASSVLSFFLDKGVPSDRLYAAGFGEHNPIFSNDNPKIRHKNRRVEIILERTI